MKVLYLDIDGVLNSHRYDQERTAGQGNIDESRLPLLREIVCATGAQIVLISSWRIHWDREPGQRDNIGRELDTLFARYGLTILDKTPQMPRSRAEQIQAWQEQCPQTVEAFVILDDAFGGWGDLAERLVKTNSRIGRGLESAHVEAAIRLLGRKEESI